MKVTYRILETFELSDGCLILYNWDDLTPETEPPVWANVQKIDSHGNVLWTVNGMEKFRYWRRELDTFVGILGTAEAPELLSFGGYKFDLDICTGEVTGSKMVK